ncbi:hypothetical protein SUGI_0355530 [Cryptomeria japonica]|nr:hypothetical protein SUGI_0355530 [Cryptomeria japonica]
MRARVYEMRNLSEDESWNLFCLFAFPDFEGNKPPEQLESLARRILEKCGRLPLAVKTVAASMASCSDLRDWESKLRQLMDGENSTMQILKLSYDSLPPCLNSCFAFFLSFQRTHNPEIKSNPEGLFDRLRVLRVLDFSSTAISTLPKCVGKLKLFRSLNLSETKIKEVPNCAGKLKCLKYLDVSGCRSLQRVPDWIDVGNLINLEEIYFRLVDEGGLTSLEDGMLEHLVKMRILDVFNAIPPREGDIEEPNLPAFPGKMKVMKIFNNLGLLVSPYQIGYVHCPLVKKVPEGLEQLKRLKRISVVVASGELEDRLKEGGEDWNKIKVKNSNIVIVIK